jgi:hypothetical protein
MCVIFHFLMRLDLDMIIARQVSEVLEKLKQEVIDLFPIHKVAVNVELDLGVL